MPNLEEFISKFNPAQKEAVSNTDGPMLVIAGAGSGKTTVLTTRIALLLEKGVAPERILALTFTKKAAEEMRARVIAMEGDAARRLMMGTFHSVFIRLLRPFAPRIAFPENFTILDEDDSLSCMKRCVDDIVGAGRPPKETWSKAQAELFKEEDKNYKPKAIHNIISACKNELITADRYANDQAQYARDKKAGRELTGKIFLAYRDACHRSAVMDFDDILLYTDMLLANNPDVQAMVAGAFDYILVDEYQDTNTAQYSILKRLTWINKNICVVGDDSQSIYAFRGARIENILSFQKDYPGATVVKLEQNYRSTKMIVGAANNLITRNEKRLPKVCFSDAERGDSISLRTCADEKEEAANIADQITAMMASGNHTYGDFAVLYRTNAQSRVIEDAMVKARIPYTVYSGTSFFERMEVKDVMAYFKLAVNPHDDESFLRVVNKPVRAFGTAAQKRLREIALQWGMSLYDTASNPSIDLCGFAAKALEGLKAFIATLNTFRVAAATLSPYDAATRIVDETGFYNEYIKDGDEESLKRADNIRELTDSVKSYEEDVEARNEATQDGPKETADLSGYLQNIMLLSNADTGEDDGEKVSLMTVHCAKGLEFDTVFVAGMEENLFPLRIENTQFEEEEERRLFYVAVTRAKKKLCLSRAEQRLKFGKRERANRSKFIGELTSSAEEKKSSKTKR